MAAAASGVGAALGPQALTRMQRELRMLEREPPPGVTAWPKDEQRLDQIEAVIQGPKDTVYHGGFFTLDVTIPQRYPFAPPRVQFRTPVYHPNIDSAGRICLDTLNMPPKGSWKPSLNIPVVLSSIRLLLSEPNPDDGLMTEITNEYKFNRELFDAKAKASVSKHATQKEAEQRTSTTTTLKRNRVQGDGDGGEEGNRRSEPSGDGAPGTSTAAGGGVGEVDGTSGSKRPRSKLSLK